jgi:hypothetical protein
MRSRPRRSPDRQILPERQPRRATRSQRARGPHARDRRLRRLPLSTSLTLGQVHAATTAVTSAGALQVAGTGAPAGVFATDQLHMQSRSRSTGAAADSAVPGSPIRAIGVSPPDRGLGATLRAKGIVGWDSGASRRGARFWRTAGRDPSTVAMTPCVRQSDHAGRPAALDGCPSARPRPATRAVQAWLKRSLVWTTWLRQQRHDRPDRRDPGQEGARVDYRSATRYGAVPQSGLVGKARGMLVTR